MTTVPLPAQHQAAETGLTPLLMKFRDSQALAKHRAMLGLELEVLAKTYDRFGWERDRGTVAHDRIVTNWMDALQDYPLSEVQAACRMAVDEDPNRMPNQGHIKKIIVRERGKLRLSRSDSPEPKRDPPCSPEAAAQILAEAGIKPKRIEAAE